MYCLICFKVLELMFENKKKGIYNFILIIYKVFYKILIDI